MTIKILLDNKLLCEIDEEGKTTGMPDTKAAALLHKWLVVEHPLAKNIVSLQQQVTDLTAQRDSLNQKLDEAKELLTQATRQADSSAQAVRSALAKVRQR